MRPCVSHFHSIPYDQECRHNRSTGKLCFICIILRMDNRNNR
ncbi:hypothetical protein SXCC_00440 [Gluconacetobacter sp. SXCC-1]|nr:hypothetical protein SXCC_00440 [Gluconacetobacter sp. SXCC-1]